MNVAFFGNRIFARWHQEGGKDGVTLEETESLIRVTGVFTGRAEEMHEECSMKTQAHTEGRGWEITV